MPTRNRRKFLPLAINCYLAQTWPNKELIIVDDGEDRVEDLFSEISSARYFFFREPDLPAHRPATTIGAKRNFACERASGRVIVHWDDDDWSAPTRIEDQATRLLLSGKGVTGYHNMLFYDPARQEASRYTNVDAQYSVGSALCYRKSYWERNKFKATSFGEDSDFTTRAKAACQVTAIPGDGLMVATIHEQNTAKRYPLMWPVVPVSTIPDAFFEALNAVR